MNSKSILLVEDNRDDVIAMGKFILYASMPIAVLALIQFKSSPDSLINKGAFHTHYATVRPSGPFSFIPGMVAFYALVASFLFYGFLKPGGAGSLADTLFVTSNLNPGGAQRSLTNLLKTTGHARPRPWLCILDRILGGNANLTNRALVEKDLH